MRKVTLTISEKIKVLANQIKDLVLPRYPPGLLLENVQSAYLWQFGYALKPPIYDCSNIIELFTKLPSVKVCTTTNVKYYTPAIYQIRDFGRPICPGESHGHTNLITQTFCTKCFTQK